MQDQIITPRDFPNGVHCGKQSGDIVVHSPVPVFDPGIPPADSEDLEAILDQVFHHALSGGQIEHVKFVHFRRYERCGRAQTVSVAGPYWISSKTELRNTTAPGMTARFTPGLKAVLFTCEGMPSFLMTSSTKFLNPATRFAPLVSIVLLSASGLPSSEFVGAKASVNAETAKRARALLSTSRLDRSMKVWREVVQAR